jgi:hypothetical protein
VAKRLKRHKVLQPEPSEEVFAFSFSIYLILSVLNAWIFHLKEKKE